MEPYLYGIALYEWVSDPNFENQLQSCMIFTENIVVGEISVNVMNSAKVMPFIY